MAWLTGYPREKVNWFPTIDHDKCVKCGMCMNCGRNVYEWTKEGPIVAQPYNCIIGCNTCANLCLGNAISFPNLNELRELYKREGIWEKVKEQLQREVSLILKRSCQER
ncbi:4Fe-4S ferredoxin [Thermoanaerobacter kivui]|uniref:4Fe-4S ferredoxin n=1 Tax=Thermoanaerobacter kivui TaxID=2325 RepID=A0A097ATG0_THEKI|nr:ferredoxin family protein [Thermoanaerobacter kivui]AIS53097.1 4Fe-4S ferredoxin [Thermoanaerobacter kivui]